MRERTIRIATSLLFVGLSVLWQEAPLAKNGSHNGPAASKEAAAALPVNLRCEYLINPLGIDKAAPQLSWQTESKERNWMQARYQILVASSPELLAPGKADVWDSGETASDHSVGILYGGRKLQSQRRYYWKVRVLDMHGRISESSEPAFWEMGMLARSDWKARWISRTNWEANRAGLKWMWLAGQNAMSVAPKTAAIFRTKITLKEKPFEGALMVASRPNYVATVNGKEVGRKHNWTSFDWSEITEELKAGENTIEIRTTLPAGDPGDSQAKPQAAAVAALVKITTSDGKEQRWATPENWEGKLEAATEWSAAQAAGELKDRSFGDPGALPEGASYLRKGFNLTERVKSARLYVTALGSYQFFVDGKKVGTGVLTPELTDYRKRVTYQVYDVTEMLARGKNVLAAILGDGWYGSGLTWSGTHFFPLPDRLMAQLEVQYSNGRSETIATDESWKGSASPILRSEIYAGEAYDARREQKGWENASFDDGNWPRVQYAADAPGEISSDPTRPPEVVMTLAPKKVSRDPHGATVFDMGQNMVGWVRLKVKGAAGTRVRMRFAEIVNQDGSIYTENLRNADATDLYILKGGPGEEFSPHFTFHGFRYVEVTGYPGTPDARAITGEVVSSVGEVPAGKLSTSSELVNHMWSIGLWGQRGNFLSIPTDCPQRDERLGWMGDAGVFWRTGSYNFDISSFSQKFVQDIVDAQTSQGAFTNISPNTMPINEDVPEGSRVWEEAMVGAPGWGDAGVIVPWTTWMQYGNTEVIRKNWDAMQRWMTFIESHNPNYLRKEGLGPNYADWLAPDEHTDKSMLATAYWSLIAKMMEDMARATGNDTDAKRYEELGAKIREAFQKEYVHADGVVATGTQTSYVVTLYTKMAPKELEGKMVELLVKDIEEKNWHLSTGFLGTPFLLFTLSDYGRDDVAYRLLLNETYPSWGYMLSKGATTWWERWNGDTGDPGMNSYNHYAFGSVVAWVYRYVAAIDTAQSAPGFKKIVVRPHLDGRMTSAKGEYESIYGRIATEWTNPAAGPFTLKVEIPANTTADVFLPKKANAQVFEAGKKVEAEEREGSFVVHIGSGAYEFEVK